VARRNDDNRCYVYTFGCEFKCDSWSPVIHPNHQKILTRACRAALTQPLPRRTALVHALLTYRQPLDLQPQLLAPSAGKRPTQN
jgi:hypothetical protein